MNYLLNPYLEPVQGTVNLTASKSESNRALLIKALCEDEIILNNLAAARDTQTMQRLLKEKAPIWDVLDAGTTMRFCTALLAVIGTGETITGTERMCQRPIGILADSLVAIGARIEYLQEVGYPPLKIHAIHQQKTAHLSLPGNVSSQFISALLMISPRLPNGLTIELTTEIFSRPYISMTLGLMKQFGVDATWEGQTIEVHPQQYTGGSYTIESDWSGASYWYSVIALSKKSTLLLRGLRAQSLQGDQEIASIMSAFGVRTTYTEEGALLTRDGTCQEEISLDFKTCPDLAQTVMVTAAMKGVTLKMTGLESLKIKETDRIAAMRTELSKLNAQLIENEDTWTMVPNAVPEIISTIHTYDDHRMAMAFAPICVQQAIVIDDPDVVAKSYPDFWSHLKAIGIQLNEKKTDL